MEPGFDWEGDAALTVPFSQLVVDRPPPKPVEAQPAPRTIRPRPAAPAAPAVPAPPLPPGRPPLDAVPADLDNALHGAMFKATDRAAVLKFETMITEALRADPCCVVEFPAMSSYHRLLVYRVGDRFQMGRVPDAMPADGLDASAPRPVRLHATPSSRIPDVSLAEVAALIKLDPAPVVEEGSGSLGGRKVMLKKRGDTGTAAGGGHKPKGGKGGSDERESAEARDKRYAEAKARLFEAGGVEGKGPEVPAPPLAPLAPDAAPVLQGATESPRPPPSTAPATKPVYADREADRDDPDFQRHRPMRYAPPPARGSYPGFRPPVQYHPGYGMPPGVHPGGYPVLSPYAQPFPAPPQHYDPRMYPPPHAHGPPARPAYGMRPPPSTYGWGYS